MKLKGRIVRVNQIPKENINDTDNQTITIQYLKKDSKQIENFFDENFWNTANNMIFEIIPPKQSQPNVKEEN